jgi:predicted amidophosphoribosyltransferase
MNSFRWRKMTWAIVLFTAFMLWWAWSTANRAAGVLTAGFALTFLFGIWLIGFLILSVIWFATRPVRRLCPVCGYEVRKGQTVCRQCGHDFASAVPASTPVAASRPEPSLQATSGEERRTAIVDMAPVLCPACGAANPQHARFCGDCGQRLGAT